MSGRAPKEGGVGRSPPAKPRPASFGPSSSALAAGHPFGSSALPALFSEAREWLSESFGVRE